VAGLDSSGCAGPCTVDLVPNTDCSGSTVAEATKTPAYLKVTHLLDPIHWMQGKYSLPDEKAETSKSKFLKSTMKKLQDPWNQAYVESIASYALGRLREEDLSPHFNMFYGAFCARADTYLYNLTDEFDTYRNSRWFWSGLDKSLFQFKVMDMKDPGAPIPDEILSGILERPAESELDSESDSDDSYSESELEELPSVGGGGDTAAECESLSTMSFVSDEEEELEESDCSEESYSSEEERYKIYAELKNFPVMLITMEANQGTLDSLLDKPANLGITPGTPEWEFQWSAWVFQIVAALTAAQRLFGFTHNDLHTNNVVWTTTKEEYFYYTGQAGTVFRVPTYGKLFRIIDFGRSILTINGQIFISDDFRPGNDAAEQYSFKPLHTNVSPSKEVAPNPSFDLCRLAVSLFDSLFPEIPAAAEGGSILSSEPGMEPRMETIAPLYNCIWSWMIDDEGRNVLVNPDETERFPDFDLYRHIAAKIHGAVPSKQFSHPAFDRFQVNPSSVGAEVKRWSLFF